MKIVKINEIKKLIEGVDLSPLIEDGFIAYSQGKVLVPPVGELTFLKPPGDTHIKYGYIKDASNFVIKIASGFYQNPELGLPSNSGLMLVFSSKTGLLDTILLDDGYLTDVRTALAGQIVAHHLAPTEVHAIGVLGTGIQARMQIEYLKPVTNCRELYVWGRTPEKVVQYRDDMHASGFNVHVVKDPAEVAANTNLIVTTTPSQTPLLFADDIKPGTHITAMGSDTHLKQELDGNILSHAGKVIADSISQCRERGEISKALKAGYFREENIIELGSYISSHPIKSRTQDEITVADLTGVAVQDIQIATAVCQAAAKNQEM